MNSSDNWGNSNFDSNIQNQDKWENPNSNSGSQNQVDEFGRSHRFGGFEAGFAMGSAPIPKRGGFNNNYRGRGHGGSRPYRNHRGNQRGGYSQGRQFQNRDQYQRNNNFNRNRNSFQENSENQDNPRTYLIKKINNSIVTLGDISKDKERVNQLVDFLLEEASKDEETKNIICSTIVSCCKELVYQYKLYSSLIGLLNVKNSDIGNQIITDLGSDLQSCMNSMDWFGLRIILRVFGTLVEVNVIEASAVIRILESFLELVKSSNAISVRSTCLVWVVGSTLVFVAESLVSKGHLDVILPMIETIEKYYSMVASDQQVASISSPFKNSTNKRLETTTLVLKSLAATSFESSLIFNTCKMYSEEFESATIHSLTTLDFSVFIDTDLAFKAKSGRSTGYYDPNGFMEQIFWDKGNEKQTIQRYLLFELISDCIVTISFNRKANSKLVHSILMFCDNDVVVKTSLQDMIFDQEANRQKNSSTLDNADENMESNDLESKTGDSVSVVDSSSKLEIEKAILVALFTLMFDLPYLTRPLIYLTSLSVELRILNPQVYSKLFEISIKKLLESDQLSKGSMDRICDFHSVYVSNFKYSFNYEGFKQFPEFLKITLKKQVRLSYLDQIKLLPQFEGIDFDSLNIRKTVPKFKFIIGTMDDEIKEISISVGKCMKDGGSATDVLRILDQAYGKQKPYEKLEMLIEHMLLSGSKSFSHMLNSIEKYSPVVQAIYEQMNEESGDNEENEKKRTLFVAQIIKRFWSENLQFLEIAMDKYVNYKLISPESVVDVLINEDFSFLEFEVWDMIINLVSKLVLRMNQLKMRISSESAANGDEGERINVFRALLDNLNKDLELVIVNIMKKFIDLGNYIGMNANGDPLVEKTATDGRIQGTVGGDVCRGSCTRNEADI
ncbi:hypothetical protein BB560_000102 [Smittium megazygosporum]|uniref:MIF4G domain-containing protein n=2 Tax=Smittium megazygosporum TaxID=133381 RepID=A0A2T9ZLB1_9FUNG|nr:hypothetical protein BB560_000102 [Smittium megazygosporum]